MTNGMELANYDPIGGGQMAPQSTEQAGAMTYAAREIEVGMLAAKRFPRQIERVEQRLAHICKRPRLAERAEYFYKRGGTAINGPTINLLRAIAGEYGNINSGFVVTDEDEDGCTLNAFAWDFESNYRACRSIRLLRSVQRRVDGATKWVKPDERDWREYVGNIGSRLERRCMENVIPGDIVDLAREYCEETRKREDAKDPDAARRRILRAFDSDGITTAMLEEYLGHSLSKASPDEWDELRKIGISIRDGATKWADHLRTDDNKAKVGEEMLKGVRNKKQKPPEGPISNVQVQELQSIAADVGAREKLAAWMTERGYDVYGDIPAARFEEAKEACK